MPAVHPDETPGARPSLRVREAQAADAAQKEQKMPNFVIDARKYSIYVRVLGGEGDGPLIYMDASGHIHVVGGGPGPLKEKFAEGLKQIEAGVGAIQQAAAQAPQR